MISSTAYERLKKEKDILKLYFGCPILDATIGGIPSQGITEISGAAGCCKTQICLTLSLRAQFSAAHGGLGGDALYFSCGEGPFPIRRLQQLAIRYEPLHGASKQLLSKVHIKECHDLEDLYVTLGNKVPEMCRESCIRLVVIDSLAGLVRFEYDNKSVKAMQQRTSLLFKLATRLKWLADIHQLCIVVVNQVTATGFEEPHWDDTESKDKPALGIAWSHCINTRIALERSNSSVVSYGSFGTSLPSNSSGDNVIAGGRDGGDAVSSEDTTLDGDDQAKKRVRVVTASESVARILRLVFSPRRPVAECRFIVNESGVFGV